MPDIKHASLSKNSAALPAAAATPSLSRSSCASDASTSPMGAAVTGGQLEHRNGRKVAGELSTNWRRAARGCVAAYMRASAVPRCGVPARREERRGEGGQNAAIETAGTAAGAAPALSFATSLRQVHGTRQTCFVGVAAPIRACVYACAFARGGGLRASAHCSDSRLMPFHFSHGRKC